MELVLFFTTSVRAGSDQKERTFQNLPKATATQSAAVLKFVCL